MTSIFKHAPQPEQSQLASHTTIKNQKEIKQVTNIQDHNQAKHLQSTQFHSLLKADIKQKCSTPNKVLVCCS